MFTINPANLAEGFTQSEMQLMDDCPEKWYLTYNLMLKKRGEFSWALQYGTWIHGALEEWYTSGCKRYTWEPELDNKHKQFMGAAKLAEMDYWVAVGRLQMEMYVRHYKADRKNLQPLQDGIEQVVDIEFEGIRLKGMIDLRMFHVLRDKNMMLDHKTCSRIDKQMTTGWAFRFQFMFYLWLVWKKWPKSKTRGMIINAIRKPGLVFNKQKESIEEHIQRIQIDMMEKPESYFYREALPLTKGALQRFEDTILRPKLERIKMFRDPHVSDKIKFAILRNKNTNHCMAYNHPCQFLGACKNGLDIEAFQFHVREVKHEELETE